VESFDSVVVHERPSLRPLHYVPVVGEVRDSAFDSLQRFLHVLTDDGGTGKLYTFTFDRAQGRLTPAAGPPIDLPSTVQSLAVHPSGKYLHASGLSVFGFAIDPAIGALTAIARPPLTFASLVAAIVSDRAGMFLFGLVGTDNEVRVFAVSASTGALSEIQHSPFPTGILPFAATTDAGDAFLYVATALTDDVSAFSIASNGDLAQLGSPVATGDGPAAVAVSSDGLFLHTVNAQAMTVSTHPRDPVTGELGAALAPVNAGGAQPNSMAVDPANGTVYVAAEFSGTLRSFTRAGAGGELEVALTARTRAVPSGLHLSTWTSRVQRVPTQAYASSFAAPQLRAFDVVAATGALVERTDSPIVLPTFAETLVSDGRFLYAGLGNLGLGAYRVASDGALIEVPGQPFAAGTTFIDLASDPSGRFLYGTTNIALHAFTIEPESGAITELPSSPLDPALGSVLSGIEVEPAGRTLLLRAILGMASFGLDTATGEFTGGGAGSVFAQATLQGIASSPRARFLYSASHGDDLVLRIPFLNATGHLQSGNVTATPTESGPTHVVTHPSGRRLYTAHPDVPSGAIAAFEISDLTAR
jgi:6-phosphogluconolactonase (cycloisomerase 2 family)